MPETSLTAASALGGALPFSRNWPGFSVSETPGGASVSIASGPGRGEDLRTAIKSAFGGALPEPGRWAQADGLVFFWTGRGQWLVEAASDGPALLNALDRAIADAASVVDQSDAWARIELAGPQSRAVLEKLCLLDLHPSVFPVGSTARTLMDHLGVSIALLDDGPRYALWVERSAARSFLHALVQAADSTCGPD